MGGINSKIHIESKNLFDNGDYNNAYEYLMNSKGDHIGDTIHDLMYNIMYSKIDLEKKIALLEKGVKSGNYKNCLGLGLLYLEIGENRNAIDNLVTAEKEGVMDATMILAKKLTEGYDLNGIRKKDKIAIPIKILGLLRYEKLMRHKETEDLNYDYFTKIVQERILFESKTEELKYLEAASSRNSFIASLMLAKILMEDNSKNYGKRIVDILSKLDSMKPNCPQVLSLIGLCYFNGIGDTERSNDYAYKYFQNAYSTTENVDIWSKLCDYGEISFFLGWIEYKRGKLREAKKYMSDVSFDDRKKDFLPGIVKYNKYLVIGDYYKNKSEPDFVRAKNCYEKCLMQGCPDAIVYVDLDEINKHFGNAQNSVSDADLCRDLVNPATVEPNQIDEDEIAFKNMFKRECSEKMIICSLAVLMERGFLKAAVILLFKYSWKETWSGDIVKVSECYDRIINSGNCKYMYLTAEIFDGMCRSGENNLIDSSLLSEEKIHLLVDECFKLDNNKKRRLYTKYKLNGCTGNSYDEIDTEIKEEFKIAHMKFSTLDMLRNVSLVDTDKLDDMILIYLAIYYGIDTTKIYELIEKHLDMYPTEYFTDLNESLYF